MTGAVPLIGSYFGRGEALVDIYYTYCSGQENSLLDCSYTISRTSTSLTSSASRPVAGVVCNGNTTSVPECEEGEVRMVGGEREGEGWVEVCVDGFWGSVCGDGFDQKAAFVICREFGYSKLLTSQHKTFH